MEDGDEEDDEDDDDDANGKGVEAAKDMEIDDCDDGAAMLSLPVHVSVPTSCRKSVFN